MERQLGLREGQKPIVNWEQEVAAANYPQIRQFYVPQKSALSPAASVDGKWVVCSPKTAADFTAVGYFFGRDLFQARHAPVGLIHSSWGGTPAESWTSLEALRKIPDFAGPVAQTEHAFEEFKHGTYDYAKPWRLGCGPAIPDRWLDRSGPRRNYPPAHGNQWGFQSFGEKAGLPDYDGVVWFRRTFDLPLSWVGTDAELHLGAVDDDDTTWVNGVEVGATIGWTIPRVYRIPAAVLRPGQNVIAVRVLDTGGGGGLYGGGDTMRWSRQAATVCRRFRSPGPGSTGRRSNSDPANSPPLDYTNGPTVLSGLYNGMIAPLLPYAIRGVIWYQGEANVGTRETVPHAFSGDDC